MSEAAWPDYEARGAAAGGGADGEAPLEAAGVVTDRLPGLGPGYRQARFACVYACVRACARGSGWAGMYVRGVRSRARVRACGFMGVRACVPVLVSVSVTLSVWSGGF